MKKVIDWIAAAAQQVFGYLLLRVVLGAIALAYPGTVPTCLGLVILGLLLPVSLTKNHKYLWLVPVVMLAIPPVWPFIGSAVGGLFMAELVVEPFIKARADKKAARKASSEGTNVVDAEIVS